MAALRQSTDRLVTLEIDRIHMTIEQAQAWCRRNLSAKFGGPALVALKPAELLTADAVRCIKQFAAKNAVQVCLVSNTKLAQIPVVYMKTAPWDFRTSLARSLGCPDQLCNPMVRQCGPDLRQLQMMSTTHGQSWAAVDPRYHAHFNVDDLLTGNFGAVPDNSFGLSHVHLNILQPSRNGGTVSLEGAANCAADLALLDTMPWDCNLELAPTTMKSSLSVNALLGKRIRIETSMPVLEYRGKRSRAAVMGAFEEQVRAAVSTATGDSAPPVAPDATDAPDASNFQLELPDADSAAEQVNIVAGEGTTDLDGSQMCDTEAAWMWFVKLRVAYVHDMLRRDCMNFDQGYRSAIHGARAPPFDNESHREWCELASGILEHLFEAYGPLRLLEMDLYAYYQIQDPIRNMEIVYTIAGANSSQCLEIAFPPYDFSLQYEEDREYQLEQLANFQPAPSAFDFESLYSGSGAAGSADGSVLGSPKVAS